MGSLRKSVLLDSLSFHQVLLFCLKLEQFEQDFLYPLLVEQSRNFLPGITSQSWHVLAKGYRIRLVALRHCLFYLESKQCNENTFHEEFLHVNKIYKEKEVFFDLIHFHSLDVISYFDRITNFKSKILYPYLYSCAVLNGEYKLAKIFSSITVFIDRNHRFLK